MYVDHWDQWWPFLVGSKCLLIQIVIEPTPFLYVGHRYYPLNDAAETINEIGLSIKRVMGGTSGILYDSDPLSFLNFIFIVEVIFHI